MLHLKQFDLHLLLELVMPHKISSSKLRQGFSAIHSGILQQIFQKEFVPVHHLNFILNGRQTQAQ